MSAARRRRMLRAKKVLVAACLVLLGLTVVLFWPAMIYLTVLVVGLF